MHLLPASRSDQGAYQDIYIGCAALLPKSVAVFVCFTIFVVYSCLACGHCFVKTILACDQSQGTSVHMALQVFKLSMRVLHTMKPHSGSIVF